MFNGGALLVDVGEMFGTSWNVAGIKATVRGGSDITSSAVRVGARVKTSGKTAAFVIAERKRAKKFESWSAIFAACGTFKLERLITNRAERDTVTVEMGSVGKLGGARVDRNNGAAEAAFAEQEFVIGDIIEGRIADEGIAYKSGVAVEEC